MSEQSVLRCPNCGAVYKGEIPEWVQHVKCPYCGAAIKVSNDASKVQVIVVDSKEKLQTFKEKKRFNRKDFFEFLQMKKGLKSCDYISGIIQLGNLRVEVTEAGQVIGPQSLKRMVERWIAEYLEILR